jgi:hypothetical protein
MALKNVANFKLLFILFLSRLINNALSMDYLTTLSISDYVALNDMNKMTWKDMKRSGHSLI